MPALLTLCQSACAVTEYSQTLLEPPFFLHSLVNVVQAIQLAALLRLEPLCEALLSSLAAAAGLEAPAPFSSTLEAKQARQGTLYKMRRLRLMRGTSLMHMD